MKLSNANNKIVMQTVDVCPNSDNCYYCKIFAWRDIIIKTESSKLKYTHIYIYTLMSHERIYSYIYVHMIFTLICMPFQKSSSFSSFPLQLHLME